MKPNVSLASLRLNPVDEADLRWRFGDDCRGDCGAKSTMGAFVEYGQLGTRVQTSLQVRDFCPDEDDRRLHAVRRLRRIDVRLSRLGRRHEDVLRAIYGERGNRRPEGLEAFQSAVLALEVGGVVLLTAEASALHARERTPRTLVEWLQEVSARSRGRTTDGKKKGDGGRDQKRRDEQVVRELVGAAETLVVRAVVAWAQTVTRRRAA